ncbi:MULTISPECIES: hypothetical protein [Schnuerera]|uniref:Uncharacterized protein n=1 Tax=[Clostridium] ultunense Esp TaxID=1288971 RepID=A0A1M4PQ21_9FIRM|nr:MULTISPECIES: hypothetical protein [Schnuerera]SHD77571.1 conserved membrane protein of unknown function [[Clostridium] ultunense Esp]HSH36252.1 hypothetical protein [Schnuerera sp.]
MKINFKEWSFGGKLIFISAIIAILSLFMSWVDAGIVRASGFQQQGYIFLVLYIYPIFKLLKGVKMNKLIGLICSILSVISGIVFLNTKNVDLFGSTVNAAGTGLYLFIIASIMLTIGVIKYKANQVEDIDSLI